MDRSASFVQWFGLTATDPTEQTAQTGRQLIRLVKRWLPWGRFVSAAVTPSRERARRSAHRA